MRQDRFLTGILIGIGALVILAVALFFARRGTLDYGPENGPDGVVRNYVIAIKKGDYDRAYGYLGAFQNKPSRLIFRQTFLNYQASQIASAGIEVGQPSIEGDTAVVQITLLQGSSDLFSSVYRNQQSASLALAGGQWKITNMVYPFWDYSWTEPVKAAPAAP